jgi:hypothetical protein
VGVFDAVNVAVGVCVLVGVRDGVKLGVPVFVGVWDAVNVGLGV